MNQLWHELKGLLRLLKLQRHELEHLLQQLLLPSPQVLQVVELLGHNLKQLRDLLPRCGAVRLYRCAKCVYRRLSVLL